MRAAQGFGIQHNKVGFARGPVGVGQQLQRTDQIAAQRLHRFEYCFGNMSFFAAGHNQPAQFDHLIQQVFQLRLQPWSFDHIRGQVSAVDLARALQAIGHLHAPQNVGPLRVNAGEQQRQ
ncbi:hypothetical protein D3C73_1142510 [compost metagenome]